MKFFAVKHSEKLFIYYVQLSEVFSWYHVWIIVFFLHSIASNGSFPKCGVYDDGCHLVKFINNHFDRDLVRTPASEFLSKMRFSVDRVHFTNHVDRWCRQHMNPDNNQSKFSWDHFLYFSRFSVKRYQHRSSGAIIFLVKTIFVHSKLSWLASTTYILIDTVPLQESRKN